MIKHKIGKIGWFLIVFVVSLSCMSMQACGNKQGNTGTHHEGSSIVWESDQYTPTFGAPADKIDYIDTTEMSIDSQYLIASLKAIVNSRQPRIWSKDREWDYYDWLPNIGYGEEDLTVYTDPYDLVVKYKDEIDSVILLDRTQMDTINAACTLAGIKPALIASRAVYYKLLSRGVELEIIENFEGKFENTSEVYQFIYDEYFSTGLVDRRAICALNPAIGGCIRDYGIAANIAFVYFDVLREADKALMEKYLSLMPAGKSAYLGWFPTGNEGTMVALTSKYGLVTWASDYLQNAIFLSGMDRTGIMQKKSPEITLENKVYVCLTFSEGDNIGTALQQRFPLLFTYEHHGDFPVSWTISPQAYYMYPQILKWFFDTADPENTNFYTGPSGVGYNYPRSWSDENGLAHMLTVTNELCKKTGIRIVNTWNDNSGTWYDELSESELNTLAKYLTDVTAVVDNSPNTATEIRGNDVLFTGFTHPYSQTTDDNVNIYEGEIEAAVDVFEEFGDPQFLSIVGNPWYGESWSMQSYEIFWEVYQNTVERYGDKVEFVTLEQYCSLLRQNQA